MKVITGSEMQNIDKRAVQDFKVPSLLLMENAGKKVCDEMLKFIPEIDSKIVGIFSGKGNNGGDGFVIARILAKRKIQVKVFLLGKKVEVSGDAKVNLNKLIKEKIDVKEITSLKDFEHLKSNAKDIDIVIDAVLGTGFKGSASGLLGRTLDFINDLKKPVISVDLPSGVNADTGEVAGSCVSATITVTLGLPKIGLLLFPGTNYVGKMIVGDIGLPKELLDNKEKACVEFVEFSDIKSILPKRLPTVHKGSVGRVLTVAGSVGYTGAAALTSNAVLRSGAGLVVLAMPASLNNILAMKLTEVITRPLPETKNGTLSLGSEKIINELSKDFQVLCLGPGIGRDKETWQLVRKLISTSKIPIVLDADGINAIASSTDILKNKKCSIIVTPHPGEMGRLINSSVENVQSHRLDIARNFAVKYGVTVVLKGANTVISSPAGKVYINSTGNSGMATAGSGDVLTGMISGFLAQGVKEVDACRMAVYIHGLSGDLVKEEKGEFGMIASDILNNIPRAIKQILNN